LKFPELRVISVEQFLEETGVLNIAKSQGVKRAWEQLDGNEDVIRIMDFTRYSYRFYDSRESVNFTAESETFEEFLDVRNLTNLAPFKNKAYEIQHIHRPGRTIYSFGSIFGTSRWLLSPKQQVIARIIKDNLVFSNSEIQQVTDRIISNLGGHGAYLVQISLVNF
jgi:hypothetical protein